MNDKVISDYMAALDRLTRGRPTRVPKGTKITNDSVALEAGRGKGAIKKSRPEFAPLIAAIHAATTGETEAAEQERLLTKARTAASKYRDELEAAIARELSLLRELYSLKKQLAALTGANVLPLRGTPPLPHEGAIHSEH